MRSCLRYILPEEIMPPDGDQRGDISSIKPTGWVQRNILGEYLYNRMPFNRSSIVIGGE